MSFLLSLLSFAVGLGCIFLFLLVAFRERPFTWLTAAYLVTSACAALWALAYTFIYQSTDRDTVLGLYKLASAGWTIGIAAAFLFAYSLFSAVVGRKPSRAVTLFLGLSAFVFWIGAWRGCLYASHFEPSPSGWLEAADFSSSWVLFFLVWMGFIQVLMLLFCVLAWRKAALNRYRRMVRMILIPSAVAGPLAFLSGLALPLMGFGWLPPLAHLLFGLLVITSGVAILRYRMLSLEPGFVIERLFFEVTDMVVLTDMAGIIRRSNQSLSSQTNLFSESLAGKPVSCILPDLELRGQAIYRAPQKRVFETDLLLPDGERIPVQGALSVVSDHHDDPVGYFFLLHDLRDVRRLAETAAALRESNEKLETLSKTDGLTGIWNRARFNEMLQAEFERYKRYAEPFTILIFDIDKFKVINDSLGHLAGDMVLKKVVARVKPEIRATDVFARWGGDEFAILSPHLDAPGAALVAERIRRAVAGISEENLCVSASIGMATVTASDTLTGLFERADAATYTAKQQGGNCFVLG